MRDARRRPMGWLFYWAVIISAFGFRIPSYGAPVPPQGGGAGTNYGF